MLLDRTEYAAGISERTAYAVRASCCHPGPRSTKMKPVAVGVDDHRGWANLVSVALHGGRTVVVDRRRVELIDPHLPGQPHHHEAQGLALDEARELVRRVAESIAESCRPPLRAL